MIHTALVSAFPTEAEARAAFTPPTQATYCGVWRVPEPYNGLVHMFTDEPPEQLNSAGWELVSSALPGDGDASFLLNREDPR